MSSDTTSFSLESPESLDEEEFLESQSPLSPIIKSRNRSTRERETLTPSTLGSCTSTQKINESDEAFSEDFYDLPIFKLTKKASELVQPTLTTGCHILDKFLRGGFPSFGITEVCGSSGNGKTNLCLQLALNVQLPVELGGLNSGAIYICTEDKFPTNRLEQLSVHFKEKYPNSNGNPMDNIIIKHIGSLDYLFEFARSNLQTSHTQARLIILDSVAALFRADFDTNDFNSMNKRTAQLRKTGDILHKLAIRNKGVIIVINQMTGSLNGTGAGATIPSLGRAWTNIISTRLQINRDSKGDRSLQVVFASHIPESEINIELTNKGISAFY